MLYELIRGEISPLSLTKKEESNVLEELKSNKGLVNDIINLYNEEINILTKRIDYLQNQEDSLFLIKSKEKRVKELSSMKEKINKILNKEEKV